MTESTARSISVRIDMETVHLIASNLESRLAKARETFDLKEAMVAYRNAYYDVARLIRPSTLGEIDNELLRLLLEYSKNEESVLTEDIRLVLEARDEHIASLL
jgi:hypothetical protein